MPPLVGYAGAAGHLGFAALVMFAIVFVWTPPHFWALALMIKEHYAHARACRCCRSSAASARPRSRSCCYTVVARSPSRSRRSRSASSGSSTASPRSCSARSSRGSRVELRRDARPRRRAVQALPLLAALSRAALRRDGRSTRWSRWTSRSRRSRDRPQEHALGLGAASASSCVLFGGTFAVGDRSTSGCQLEHDLDHRARRRRRRAGGSRSRTSSTRPGSGRRTGRRCSPTTCPTVTAEAVRRLEARRLRRTSGKTNLHEFAYGVTSQNLHYGDGAEPGVPRADAGRLERRLGGGARRSGSPTARSARTPAARSASRPPAAASPGSSRPTGSFRSTASSRSRRASTTPGRWRATSRAASS